MSIPFHSQVKLLLLSVLCKEHVLLLGPPGTGNDSTEFDYSLAMQSRSACVFAHLDMTGLCLPVLYCAVLFCAVLYCTVLYCTVLYCTVLYCAVLFCAVLCCTVLYCTVLYCTVLYCTVLFCTGLDCTGRSIYHAASSCIFVLIYLLTGTLPLHFVLFCAALLHLDRDVQS